MLLKRNPKNCHENEDARCCEMVDGRGLWQSKGLPSKGDRQLGSARKCPTNPAAGPITSQAQGPDVLNPRRLRCGFRLAGSTFPGESVPLQSSTCAQLHPLLGQFHLQLQFWLRLRLHKYFCDWVKSCPLPFFACLHSPFPVGLDALVE